MTLKNFARLASIFPAFLEKPSQNKRLFFLSLYLFSCSFFPPALAQDAEALRKTYQQVIDSYPQQLKAAREEGQRGLEAQLLANAGIAYQYLGDYQKAISLYQEGLAIAKSLPDPGIMEEIVNMLGTAYSKMGDDRGIGFFTEQLKQARASGDRTLLGILLKYLGFAYLSLSDYPKAIEVYEEYLPLVRASKNRTEEAQALTVLSAAYGAVRQLEKQVTLLQEQLTISQEIGNLALQISALSNLIFAYQNLERDRDAIASAEQAVQIAQKGADSYQEAFALQQLALLHGRLGNSEKLIALLEASLARSQQNKDLFSQAFTLQYLSTTYGFLGNYAKAIDLQKQGLKIYQTLRQQQGVKNLQLSEIFSLSNLAIQQYKSGLLTEAESNLKLAIKTYNEVGKEMLGNTNLFAMTRDELNIGIRESITELYRTLQQVLIATNRTNEALEIAEAGKARAFIDLLIFNLGATPQSSQATPELNLEQMRQIAKAQNSTLVQYSLVYKTNGFSAVRLGKQPAYETDLYIWVIKPTGEITFRKSDLEAVWEQNQLPESLYSRFTALVIDTRNSIFVRGRGVTSSETKSDSNPASPRSNSRRLQLLHQILIDPIADLLPTNPQQRVTFIPQSVLFLVPFPALQDANGKYLIEKHTILTAPSIQVLDLTHQQRQRLQTSPNQTALVAGNPTMPSLRLQPGEPLTQLPSLPGSEAEAKAIASLLKTQPLIGPQATESAVVQQMQNARFIHLATHGLLDNLAGFQSSLAFASTSPSPGQKASENDGFLTAREILNLKLKAELVVLSACDTGRGRISGDGIIGLSRSFIAAGASSVIVSLWKVPDKPTSDLMLAFYQNLQKQPDKAQALRQAMLATLEKYPSPRDWAAFTLIGEAEWYWRLTIPGKLALKIIWGW